MLAKVLPNPAEKVSVVVSDKALHVLAHVLGFGAILLPLMFAALLILKVGGL